MTSSTDEQVYSLLLKLGTATINQLASILKRKHETVARAVQRLEENGRVNTLRNGNKRYVTLRPDSHTKRVRPVSQNLPPKTGNKSEVYARGSSEIPFMRAKTVSERVPLDGFVLHPSTRGCDIGREWVRCHINGTYNIRIRTIGDFKAYNRDDDVAINWKLSNLNTNKAYNGKVFLKGTDTQAYSIRAVESKGGSLELLSVYVHPRYIFHKGHETTSEIEFKQQVKDVCKALEVHGWEFDYESIELKGQFHTGINDSVLGSLVGPYNQTPEDQLHFDHSHGIPECEVYGSDADTVELMVNLPNTIRGMAESLELLTNLVNQIIEVQTKTITLMVPKNENQTAYDVMFR